MRTIRRSVYIGLGGTGVKAIAHVKKMYEDVFGDNIPNQIAFVAIDYDVCTLHDDALPTSMVRDLVPLPNLPIREIYFANKENGFATWMIPENEKYIPDHLGSGASQVRTSGRLITEMLMPHISSSIHRAIQRVMCLNVLDEEYAVDGDPKIDVHIATSLAGGTGSGSFINVALCVKEMLGPRANIMGYGVLHGVFRAMDPGTLATPRVRLNSYSAVIDLDYLQSATSLNPVSLNVCGTPRVITVPLFDNFFLIDNVTEYGVAINNVNDLCHHLASNMFHFGGDIGCVLRSGFLFAEAIGGWKHGWYDFIDKKGWVQRLGFCQIVYDGERLAGLYAQKAKIELIRQSLCGGSDVDQMAAEWCESNGLGASETHDRLIDVIFSPAEFGNIAYPNLNIEVRYEEMYDELGKYLANFQNFPTKESLLNLRDRILESLNAKVAEILNGVGGVADAQAFLTALARTCTGYKNEMEAERECFINSVLREELALDVACKEYQDYRGRVFKTKNGMQERLDYIAHQAKVVLKAKEEAKIREEALVILSALENEIEKALEKVMNLRKSLDVLRETYTADFIQRQNVRSRSYNFFEYDLSVEEGLNMTLSENEISLTDFMSSLAKPFAALTKEEIDLALDAFTASLPRCEQYRTTLINDVIHNLSAEGYMKLKSAVQSKISPLLPLQCRCPKNMMTSKICAVSIYRNYSQERSRLENDSCIFERGIDCHFIPSSAPEMRQKVVFFRIDSAVIPYCLEAFDASIEQEYYTCLSATQENTRFNPHFDLQIFQEMRKRDFKLKPETTREAMFYWVAGQFFGWTEVVEKARNMEKDQNGATLKEIEKVEVKYAKYIRFDKTKYRYWNEKGQSRGQSEKWTDFLTANRKRAFEFFKFDVLPLLRDEYKSLILHELNLRGTGYYKTVIDNLKADGKQDYIDKVMCSNKSSVTYYSADGKTVEAEFVDQEWAYIESEFLDTLLLLR